jgi:ribokinase
LRYDSGRKKLLIYTTYNPYDPGIPGFFVFMVRSINRALVVGSSNVDLVFSNIQLPQPGETLTGSGFKQFYGGKGANQAIALQASGEAVCFVSALGRDAFGTQYLDHLKALGIPVDGIFQSMDASTGIAGIFVGANGENSISVAPGANRFLEAGHLERVLGNENQAFRYALLQMELRPDVVELCISVLHSRQIPVVLNLAPFFPLTRSTLEKVEVLVLNQTEAQSLAGWEITDRNSGERICQYIQTSMGIPNVVLTLGGDGAIWCGKQMSFSPAFPVDVVDATGAGDVFCAYFSRCFFSPDHKSDALRRASAAAALSIQKMGAQPGIPSWEQVDQFLNGQPG